MRKYVGTGFGKVLVINLERGELLLETIRDKCKEAGIKDAVVLAAIGSLQKVHYHRVMDVKEPPRDEFIWVEAPCELGSLQGVVADGQPHFHIAFSDLEKSYEGHLEDGTEALYLVEIVLAEITGVCLERKKNENGIPLLEPKVG
ncbi:MAG: DNA-binding protein [Negativicutes bacterium]|nr:DNA-binding protein [Negativicutes bacterium]